MNYLKKWGLAALLMLFATAALAGWNITQNNDGSMCWNDGTADAFCIDVNGNMVLSSGDVFDLNGNADGLVIDADADTSISAPTDDQIDIELTGTDQVRIIGVKGVDSGSTNDLVEIFFTTPIDTTGNNTHNALTIDLAIGNATGGTNVVTALQIDGISADAQVTETGIIVGTGWDIGLDISGNRLDLDADNDTSIDASADDVVDFEVGSDVVLQLLNNTGNAHAYMIPGNELHIVPRNVISVFDDFLQQTIVETDGPWIFNDGADAEAVDPVIEAIAEGGVITLVSGNVGDGCTNDCSQIVLSVPFQADSGALVFETRLHIDSAITTATVHAGFTDITTEDEEPASVGSSDTLTTNATNAVVFVYDTDADTDQWFCIGVDGGTDAVGSAATGVAPTADTYQVLRIEIDADGETARCYIDGTLRVSLTATATNASVNLFAIIGVLATTTTSRTVDVDYIYVGSAR